MSTLRVDNILPYTSGSTITIAGFSTAQTPTANDFINVQSYDRWVYGEDVWPDISKWQAISLETFPTDYLRFILIGGEVNGVPINRTYVSTSVNYTNLTFRDDGFGSFPVNYVDFINGIFASHSIYTRITGSLNNIQYNYSAEPPWPSGSIGFTGSYCAVDSFNLLFLEVGQINDTAIQQTYYKLSTQNGMGLVSNGISITSTNNIADYRLGVERSTTAIQPVGRGISNIDTIWYQPTTPGL